MPPNYSRYCRPSDIKQPTWSVVSGSENSAYPVSRLGDQDPANPFKATGTAVTVRGTFGSAVTLVGIAIPSPHNLAGASVTLTSGSGLNRPLTVAANTGGQANIILDDFSSASSSQRTSTQFDLAITGGLLGNIAIGEVCLIAAWRDLKWLWGLQFKPRRLVSSPGETFGGSRLRYNKRIRIREGRGKVQLQTEEAALRILEEEAEGEIHPWIVVPDPTKPEDSLYVQFIPGSFSWSPKSIGSTEVPIEIEEVPPGPPLFP